MARDDAARENEADEPLLDRRSYLRLAGTAAVSVAAANVVGGTADAAEYRTITVPAGETRTITVGSGETFENVLIDMTADGASAHVTTSGSGWTIRNVGFKGNHPGGHYLMTPGVASADGQGLIENVYLGDGQTPRSKSGGIWVDANMPHRGTITFRNVHIAHMVDNGLYGSGPGAQGAGGNEHVESSYFHANTISNVRLNAKDRTCNVRDTVVNVDGSQPPCGTGCSAPGSTTTRAIWAWYGEVHLQNCDITGRIATKKGGTVTQSNTRTGSDANTSPPDGVPMTAEEAASGGGSGNASDAGDGDRTARDDLPNSLSISGGASSNPTRYRFGVTDGIRKTTDRSATVDSEDTIESGNVEGAVAGGTDSYAFAGSLSDFSVDGEATIHLNGERVDPANVGDDGPSLPNELVIDGSDASGGSEYSFDVSGEIEKRSDLGSVDPKDTIENGTVTGSVVDGSDGYRFSGDVTRFRLEGPATVTVESRDG